MNENENTADLDANEHEGYHLFKDHEGNEHGSFQVFWRDQQDDMDGMDDEENMDGTDDEEDHDPLPSGWYWWACFPGCMPDGDPSGPFDTSTDAYNDAQER